MGSVSCIMIDNEAELRNFDCGVSTVNDLVANSFYPHLLQQRMVFKILCRGRSVGFFSVSILSVSLENSDAEIAEYYIDPPSFGAVKLDYIAVAKETQRRGIGTIALEYVIIAARELRKTWPIRLMVLDAIRDKIEWYKTLGFEALSCTELNGTSPTVHMYLDLMPEEDKKGLDTYVTHVC